MTDAQSPAYALSPKRRLRDLICQIVFVSAVPVGALILMAFGVIR